MTGWEIPAGDDCRRRSPPPPTGPRDSICISANRAPARSQQCKTAFFPSPAPTFKPPLLRRTVPVSGPCPGTGRRGPKGAQAPRTFADMQKTLFCTGYRPSPPGNLQHIDIVINLFTERGFWKHWYTGCSSPAPLLLQGRGEVVTVEGRRDLAGLPGAPAPSQLKAQPGPRERKDRAGHAAKLSKHRSAPVTT